ncbi:MAG TPA: phosphomethylpyrimidine synthase ThiC [Methanoregulaceae archaeon]|nr:MAG: phosphomethylpyrimidine synthase ThiC [Methanolinea sp.]HON80650.1 phosphomethylpyrimidine synthase ThiC [Methanoregulaceae archaeon]HPD09384.1 phosphomethylpyrimidine synthase ThiC [Methanoregulaceae archaeon]HRT14823.1 phosphomethylpyrimidine synthase ThiC [Methanoregulaceae archaeon]HRU30396.1 phosphomethylpyrimidine synthase ThiC [Methanoregulaceae archaeon]
METVIDAAIDGEIPELLHQVAAREGIDPDQVRGAVLEGSMVFMQRGDHALGIGRGLCTRVNVNIGTSSTRVAPEEEVEKARIAERFGADTITDLSMGGDIRSIRESIIRATTIPLTTVPIYETAARVGLAHMTEADLLSTIRDQAAAGVSSMVLHFVDRKTLGLMEREQRISGVVSKGGSLTCVYMHLHDQENPFIELLDEILGIFRRYDTVLSLGNTARGGGIHDGWGPAQQEELRRNCALGRYAREQGIQVIIEGAGGHVRYNRIAPLVRSYKKAAPYPLFVAGPLPTDIALGYDHIAGCAGAAAASAAGADYICSISPSEHLGLPGPDQVKEGLIAFRIAAHIGDIVKYGKDAADKEISLLRSGLDREGQFSRALDEQRARDLAGDTPGCSMCGDFCAIRLMKALMAERRRER